MIESKAVLLVTLAVLAATPLGAQACETPTASLSVAHGLIEVRRAAEDGWQVAAQGAPLCAGDRLRVDLSGAVAIVSLHDEADTRMRLDAGSAMTLRSPTARKRTVIDLLRGALHAISRVRGSLDINTAYVNAKVEGTEFTISADEQVATLDVHEGVVAASNSAGEVRVASGQSISAVSDLVAPQRGAVARSRADVTWALRYPPLIDLADGLDPRITARYQSGDFAGALALVDAGEGASVRARQTYAGVAFALGRVTAAEGALDRTPADEPRSMALRAAVAVARGERDKALAIARIAHDLAPDDVVVLAALGYAQQAAGAHQAAYATAGRAAGIAPDSALVMARLAEMAMIVGERTAALKAAGAARSTDPSSARAAVVLAFAELNAGRARRARERFGEAVALDPADPEARLGLALTMIRANDIDSGREQLEFAALLSPTDARLRSYLGKAYDAERRSELAATEFDVARLLDPNDPTPWLYDGLRKQREGRPIEALRDLQASADRNEARGVYRSSFRLEADAAARGASLGLVYADLGFEQLGLLEGWQATRTDPGNTAGHRLLASLYSSLPRHEVARVSEVLQAQAAQPVSQIGVQAAIAESDLGVLGGAGFDEVSFNEYSPLFERNGAKARVSGLVGNDSTFAGSFTAAGVHDNVGWSIGRFSFNTDTGAPVGTMRRDVTSVMAQADLTATISVQAELRQREDEDEQQPPAGAGEFRASGAPDERTREVTTARLGARFGISSNTTLTLSGVLASRDEDVLEPEAVALGLDQDGWLMEARVDHALPFGRLRTGGGISRERGTRNTTIFVPDLPALPLLPQPPGQDAPSVPGETDLILAPLNLPAVPLSELVLPAVSEGKDSAHAYAFVDLPLTATIDVTAGLALSRFALKEAAYSRTRWEPSLGISFMPIPGTRLRASAARTTRHYLPSDQTLQPTHVAGWNQLFDDIDGSQATRIGVAIDQKVSQRLYVGAEASRREVDSPYIEGDGSVEERRRTEHFYRAYLYATPLDTLALSASAEIDEFRLEAPRGGVSRNELASVSTRRIPFDLRWFATPRVQLQLGATWVDQRVRRRQAGPDRRLHSQFWTVDAQLSYRLPRLFDRGDGELRLGVRNLFDRDFDYVDEEIDRGNLRVPRLSGERLAFAQAVFSFE